MSKIYFSFIAIAMLLGAFASIERNTIAVLHNSHRLVRLFKKHMVQHNKISSRSTELSN
jgi:hypothetical protein